MLFAIVMLVTLQPKISALKSEGAALSEQIAALEQSNRAAQAKLDALGTDESVIAIAREKLNLAFEDEIVFVDRNR
ncbi:MAG: septum formation initiator family protein [Oscillospiraceae bacterium]|nr:septum formation initiator family protein [Oscillospiraceae bacterium]